MIISIDAEKAFDKIQHQFMIKTLQKVGIEGTYLNIIKAMYDKRTVNFILSGEKLKAFPQDQEQYKNIHSHKYFSTFFGGSQPQKSEKKKKQKEYKLEKKEVKLSLFADDMIDTIYRKS